MGVMAVSHRSGSRGKTPPGTLGDEIAYVRRRARDHSSTVVFFGSLILFSSESGDAWVLDPSDNLAACIARAGDPEELSFWEDSNTCTIDWKGNFYIQKDLFCYIDGDSGRKVVILGYPTEQIEKYAERSRKIQ